MIVHLNYYSNPLNAIFIRLRGGTVVGICANLACLLATLLQPYMPETSGKLKAQLNCADVVLNPK